MYNLDVASHAEEGGICLNHYLIGQNICLHKVKLGDFPLDKLLKIPFFVQAPMSRSISIQIRNSNEQTVR